MRLRSSGMCAGVRYYLRPAFSCDLEIPLRIAVECGRDRVLEHPEPLAEREQIGRLCDWLIVPGGVSMAFACAQNPDDNVEKFKAVVRRLQAALAPSLFRKAPPDAVVIRELRAMLTSDGVRSYSPCARQPVRAGHPPSRGRHRRGRLRPRHGQSAVAVHGRRRFERCARDRRRERAADQAGQPHARRALSRRLGNAPLIVPTAPGAFPVWPAPRSFADPFPWSSVRRTSVERGTMMNGLRLLLSVILWAAATHASSRAAVSIEADHHGGARTRRAATST